MAVSSRGSTAAAELRISRRWKERETSPERNRVWIEPKSRTSTERKVPVVYSLCRNGQLEQPHLMEVPLASNEGLHLRDVINRLNQLRGNGMASLYSWSSKRSYKNGFVWNDLAENDFIYPTQGNEYVLKGSEIIEFDAASINSKPLQTTSFRALKPPDIEKSGEESDFPVITRRRNQSWSSIDLNEYKVYKTEATSESTRNLAADASTQTDDRRRRRKPVKEEEIQESQEEKDQESNQSTELSREEISPPPSDSSPETLESLMKACGRPTLSSGEEAAVNRTSESCPSGRMKASMVLMQLISCGSMSFKDCGPTLAKDQGFSLVGHYKARLPRGGGNQVGTSTEISNFTGVKLEDKEYFSGSLIDSKKEDIPVLKRSNSYNADRTSQLLKAENEMDGVRVKCIPGKPKTQPSKSESNTDIHGGDSGSTSQRWSKRLEVQQVG
ncbi:hypothetical protein HS088_TW02G00498 [Tripterygium wilfordii]|uniref:SOSEKI DIX-like domain-containing protein n=1 Tax=Tripterygium wilfordii TaxID=458696 RepID=A0A7J7DZ70_TRIWF|nr:protein UPSTREAM OF FLC-like [Tripterygium wilfordii]KAF5751484.1 hypothetical protein HS088_TW02G00498 [Tripterygium wilfordii]